MKKRILQFMPFLAALTLAGCASEELVPDETGSNDNKELSYIAVNIVQPKDASVRAGETRASWETGSPDENYVDNAVFCIFKENNEFYDNTNVDTKFIVVKGLTPANEQPGNNPNTEKVYDAVLVLKKNTVDEASQAKKLVCLLNLTNDQLNNLKESNITNLSGLMSVVNNFETGAEYGEEGKKSFVMSNAVYIDTKDQGSTEYDTFTYTAIKPENLANTEEEAKDSKKAVNVYVERVVAKVKANFAEDFDQEKDNNKNGKAHVNIDNVSHDYKIKITGIEVANIANKAYLLKNIGNDANNATFSDGINDTNNKRYNWEEVPSLNCTNRSYNQIVYDDDKFISKDVHGNPIIGETDPNSYDIKNEFFDYIQPNTKQGPNDKKTSILVTAVLQEEVDGKYQDVGTFVYLRGFYYSEANAKQEVANYLQGQGYYSLDKEKSTETNKVYVSISPNDIDWAWGENDTQYSGLKDYEVVPQVKSGTEVYKKENGKDEYNLCKDLNDVNNLLKSGNEVSKDEPYYKARVFRNGRCYYYTEIEHEKKIGADNKIENALGIVRNNIYNLTLKSIKGLGTPVYDTNKVIIPEKPTDDVYYLSAKINVLSWRLQTQTVDFSGN